MLAKALRWYLRSDLRGRTHLTRWVTRLLPPLWSVPIHLDDRPPVYVDLRTPYGRDLLAGEPWPQAPWEPAEQALMRRVVTPGDVAVDIGANIGLHTALLSRLVGPHGAVHVFEPNAALLPGLRRTVRAIPNATLYPYALSDEKGPSTLFVSPDHLKTSLANWTNPTSDGVAQAASCERRRLDDLWGAGRLSPPHFIKCDVEGAELQVFRGAESILNQSGAPLVLFEMNGHTARGFGLSARAATAFLASLPRPAFQFFSVAPGGHLSRLDDAEHWGNVLAVPQAKRHMLETVSATR